jgi:3-hydroxymyristoyl/3-hydroxydecanoyl-(acyl carrier protein) dehydratase
LLIEGLAQTAAVLNGTHEDSRGRGLLVGLKNLRMYRRVRVGERLRFEIDLIRRLPPLVLTRGRASVGDEVVAEGELKFFVESS